MAAGCAKYTILLFNFLIVLAGIAIIAIGGIALSKDYAGVTKQVTIFGIIVGVVIFFIAFLGCCGAMKESKCLLTTYAVILIILFILEVIVGILAFIAVNSDEFKKDINKELSGYITRDEIKDTMNDIQKSLKCCGANSSKDYFDNGHAVPESCKDKDGKVYPEGCTDALLDFLKPNIKGVGGVAIGFAVVELVAAIFACHVRNSL